MWRKNGEDTFFNKDIGIEAVLDPTAILMVGPKHAWDSDSLSSKYKQ
jgi:hypothetical protein